MRFLRIPLAYCLWTFVAHIPCLAGDQLVMRFVENPRTSENVVRLGDLVEVIDGHDERIEQILEFPLGPAPRENAVQVWHSSDILQHLDLRGVRSTTIRWSGNTQAKLQRLAAIEGSDHENFQPAFVQQRTIDMAENLVAQAISEYLNLRTGDRTDWRIRVQVPAKLADVIRIRRNILGIGGGTEPWLGQQKFVLQVKESDRVASVTIEAVVELPPMVVVARRPMRREEIITQEALDLAPLPNRGTDDPSQYFTDVDQLLGKQLKRAVSTGLPISSEYVGEPQVIGRNEMIEVESVSGPVVVRTMARSLGAGAIGDLIDIETIPSRRRMLATVVGPMRVRVAAVAARGAVER
jgi:flagella basal body P-ring formation protein FlgA